MWNAVCQQISEVLHQPFEIAKKSELPGQDYERRFKISNGTTKFLVKVARIEALERFECEAKNRTLLIRDSDFLVADSIVIGTTMEFSYHVLEWVTTEAQQDNWFDCGVLLAKMHQRDEQKMYGLEEDNYLHTQVQPNRWHKKWDTFFAEERIGWQLQLLAEQGISIVDIKLCVDTIRELLPHHVTPALLHGDFWRGNIGFHNNKPVLFKPACYYGDREVDIATSELYGKLPEAFFAGYDSIYPLHHGYETRKKIYQLYPLLHQANRYAGNYLMQAKQAINAILEDAGK
ncbi:Ribulosamine/erythrulosamine 3-kinase potentially involved in protein deglycation [Pseudoalteromonas luteoviolacea B = ATCC 29581]|nr:Ribulosamine/erythrulosamine 3-kinase potentially involved in protein deglycation [Pseudoalteromonas luteoviolacea B = ATCC 29581]